MSLSGPGALLILHTLAAVGFVLLFQRAPCWMQRIVVLLLCCSMATLGLGDWFVLWTGWDYGMRDAGYQLMHVAVLLYVFRLIYQDQRWATSSALSRSSRG